MSVQSMVIETSITGNATEQKLWEQSCPTVVKRRIVELRAKFTGAGKLNLTRETDSMAILSQAIVDYLKQPEVVDIDWGPGVTIYLYGTDVSGAANAIKLQIFYEELPV